MSCLQLEAVKAGDTLAVMHTNMGDVEIKLFPEHAPKTVENFTTHAKNGYYNGLIFHRVIKDFMIQGGDPTGTGMGGESIWGNSFEDEFTPKLHNLRGALCMANAGPNTNGSQFFIVQSDSKYLDGSYAAFGHVTSGIEIVDKICKDVPTIDSNGTVTDKNQPVIVAIRVID